MFVKLIEMRINYFLKTYHALNHVKKKHTKQNDKIINLELGTSYTFFFIIKK